MAYTTATVVQKDPPAANGRTHLVIEFTGEKVEPFRVDKDVADETPAQLGAWARGELTRLNAIRATATAIRVADTLDLTVPEVDKAVAAEAKWFEQARRLVRMRAIASTNESFVAELDALQKAVDAGFVNTYVPKI